MNQIYPSHRKHSQFRYFVRFFQVVRHSINLFEASPTVFMRYQAFGRATADATFRLLFGTSA
jgi:hypothetical protein